MRRPVNERVKSRDTGAQKHLNRVRSKRKPVDTDDEFEEPPKRRRKPRKKDQTKELDAVRRDAIEAMEAFEDIEDGDGPVGPDVEAMVNSTFHKDFDKLRTMLSPDNVELRVDQAAPLLFRAALAMILDLLPIAEHKYRKSRQESAAYALTAMINQARDLTNDVRLSEDTEGRAVVLGQIINMNFVRIAELLLNEKYALQRKLEAVITDATVRRAFKAELDKMVLSYTKGLKDIQGLLTDQSRGYLLGDANYLNPSAPEPAKKRKRKKSGK